MAGKDPFEGLLAKLTTEEGKEELIRDELERREGVEVVSMERTSTGWRVVAERKPGAGGDEGRRPSGSVSIYVPTFDEQHYWYDINGMSKLNIPLSALGTKPERRLGGIRVIKKVIEETGVSREEIRDIEMRLVEINSSQVLNYTDPEVSWEGYCSKTLFDRLEHFWGRFQACYGIINMLPIISGYRRLGTDVPGADDYGEADAGVKIRGHWRGNSVDLPRSATYDFVQILLNRYFGGRDRPFEAFLHESKLCRPYRGLVREKNHVTLRMGGCPGF